MRSWEDSLQRLGMNRVDLLIIHDLDMVNLGSEALVAEHLDVLAGSGIRALQDLKAAGRIGAIGAGVNRIGTILRFLDLFELDFFLVASPYTLADQPALDAEFPRASARGVGLIIGQVFASGILATGPVPARATTTPSPRPKCWSGSGASRLCAADMACRSPPPRCSSRCTTRWLPR